jgi:hypothetical protein
MQANELKIGDIFRVDEPGYSNEPLVCVDIQEYHVVYQPLNTSKLFNMSKGNKVVILEQEEEKISDSEVHNPKRYNANKVECWDFIAKYDLDYFVATAIKYVWRHKYKGGKQDLEKALEFLHKRIKLRRIYERPSCFTYEVPQVIDYQDMDISQMVILYYASRLHVVSPDAQKQLVIKIKCLVEDYINELY